MRCRVHKAGNRQPVSLTTASPPTFPAKGLISDQNTGGAMLKLMTVLSLLGLGAILSGCNSTDALIPRADVGDASFQSPPVTQADLDSMSDTPAVAGNRQPGDSGQSAAFSDPAPANNDGQTAITQGTYTDPAGSLDAQAQQLADGGGTANLSAEQPAAREQTRQTQQQAALSPAAGTATIRFLPIIGAPVEAVTPLSKQLGAEARAKGLTIKSSADPDSDHILKGYFSALSNGGKTTVTYVWDVLDGSGNRLHRIQGQDEVEGSAANPWGAVPASAMQQIAAETMNQYMSWRQSSGI